MSRIESKPSMVSHRLELDERFSCSPIQPFLSANRAASRRRQPIWTLESAKHSSSEFLRLNWPVDDDFKQTKIEVRVSIPHLERFLPLERA